MRGNTPSTEPGRPPKRPRRQDPDSTINYISQPSGTKPNKKSGQLVEQFRNGFGYREEEEEDDPSTEFTPRRLQKKDPAPSTYGPQSPYNVVPSRPAFQPTLRAYSPAPKYVEESGDQESESSDVPTFITNIILNNAQSLLPVLNPNTFTPETIPLEVDLLLLLSDEQAGGMYRAAIAYKGHLVIEGPEAETVRFAMEVLMEDLARLMWVHTRTSWVQGQFVEVGEGEGTRIVCEPVREQE